MSWSLADSLNHVQPSLTIGGGSCHDIAPMIFASQALKAIKDRIHNYVSPMRLVNKSPTCIRLSQSDYTKLVAAVAKAQGVKVAEISGLRHDGIPVVSERNA